mgnify:CR=1 FL=1
MLGTFSIIIRDLFKALLFFSWIPLDPLYILVYLPRALEDQTHQKIKNNTTNKNTLSAAIKEKVQELNTLKYPRKYIENTLKYMMKKTGDYLWSI